MNKRKLLRIIFVVMILLLNLIVFLKLDYIDLFGNEDNIMLVVRLSSNSDGSYQVYFSGAGENFSPANCEVKRYTGYGDGTFADENGMGQITDMMFKIPLDKDNVSFNISARPFGVTNIYDMYFATINGNAEGLRVEVPLEDIMNAESQINFESRQLLPSNDPEGQAEMLTVSPDEDASVLVPYHKDELMKQAKDSYRKETIIIDTVVCLIVDLVAVYVLLHFFSLVEIPIEIYQNRKLAFTLAKNDFKTKYAGSYLGMIWAFIQPVVTILVYWFVFSVGLKAGNVGEYPFVLFIVVGIIPWFFFSDALNGGTNALTDYNYLVKKVVFNIDILPFVKVLSALFVHFFFIGFALILCTCLGYHPTIYSIQLIYYIICNVVFVLGLSYLSASIVVFFRDLGQFINIFILQVGVWLTPIMWNAENVLSPTAQKLFRINPMYYIVSGFRDSMLDYRWFWSGDKLLWTIYFWTLTVLVFGLGVKIFRRLKVHFADVL